MRLIDVCAIIPILRKSFIKNVIIIKKYTKIKLLILSMIRKIIDLQLKKINRWIRF